MDALIVSLQSVWNDSGFEGLTSGNVIMLIVGLVLLYLLSAKGLSPCCWQILPLAACWATFPKPVSLPNPVLCRLSCTVSTTKYSPH